MVESDNSNATALDRLRAWAGLAVQAVGTFGAMGAWIVGAYVFALSFELPDTAPWTASILQTCLSALISAVLGFAAVLVTAVTVPAPLFWLAERIKPPAEDWFTDVPLP